MPDAPVRIDFETMVRLHRGEITPAEAIASVDIETYQVAAAWIREHGSARLRKLLELHESTVERRLADGTLRPCVAGRRRRQIIDAAREERMRGGMVRAVGLVTRRVLDSRLWVALVQVCWEAGIDLDGRECHRDYLPNLDSSRFAVTWGMKLPHDRYTGRGSRTVLFVENSLLKQSWGVFLDDCGFFADSSIVRNHECEQPLSEEDAASVAALRERFGWSEDVTYDPDGPVLVALQTPRDAPLLYYFPLGKRAPVHGNLVAAVVYWAAKYMPRNRKVLVRPHPRARDALDGRSVPDGWEIDDSQNVYELLPRCSALVTANSTLATEALVLGMPVAVLGKHVFTGSGAVLDCSDAPERLMDLPHWRPERERVERYLAAVCRHLLPYDATVEDVAACASVQRWLARIAEAQKPKPRKTSAGCSGRDILAAASMTLTERGWVVSEVEWRNPPSWEKRGDPPHPGQVVDLGFVLASHLGDALCGTALVEALAERGCKVRMVRHRSTYTVYAHNPHICGWHSRRGQMFGGHWDRGPGHVIQRIFMRFGLTPPERPKPVIYLSEEEKAWAQEERKRWPLGKPVVVLSTNAITAKPEATSDDWQALADALMDAGAVVVHCAISRMEALRSVSKGWPNASFVSDPVLKGVIRYENLPIRRVMSLYSVADAYAGPDAGCMHVAAAFDLPLLVVLPWRRFDILSFPSVHQETRFLYPSTFIWPPRGRTRRD